MEQNNKTGQAPTEMLLPAEYKNMRVRAVCVEQNMNSFESTENEVRPEVTNDCESNFVRRPKGAMLPIITDSAYITDFFDSEYYY